MAYSVLYFPEVDINQHNWNDKWLRCAQILAKKDRYNKSCEIIFRTYFCNTRIRVVRVIHANAQIQNYDSYWLGSPIFILCILEFLFYSWKCENSLINGQLCMRYHVLHASRIIWMIFIKCRLSFLTLKKHVFSMILCECIS